MNGLRIGQAFSRQIVLHFNHLRLDVDDHQLGRQTVLDEQYLVQTNELAGVKTSATVKMPRQARDM